MTKIQRVSGILKELFHIGMWVLPVLLIAGWVLGPDIYLGTHQFGVGFSAFPRHVEVMQPITTQTRLLGFLVGLMPTLVTMYLLYCLRQLFACYGRGEIFTLRTVRYIRNIGITLLVQVLVEMIYIVLINYVLNGMNTLHLNFSSVNISVVLLAVLIIINSWIMSEGYKLHQEQELTI